MSVGSVCVLGEHWLELLADRFLLLLLLLLMPKLFVHETFLGRVSLVSEIKDDFLLYRRNQHESF